MRSRWPSIFNHQNLIGSSLSPRQHLYWIWKNSLGLFLRYCVHKAKHVLSEVTVTLTFDHLNLTSSSLSQVNNWTKFEEVPLEVFLRYVSDVKTAEMDHLQFGSQYLPLNNRGKPIVLMLVIMNVVCNSTMELNDRGIHPEQYLLSRLFNCWSLLIIPDLSFTQTIPTPTALRNVVCVLKSITPWNQECHTSYFTELTKTFPCSPGPSIWNRRDVNLAISQNKKNTNLACYSLQQPAFSLKHLKSYLDYLH